MPTGPHTRCLLLLIGLIWPVGYAHAGRRLVTVDFKYDSSHHLPPAMWFTQVSQPPKKVVELLTKVLRSDGAVLIDRQPGAVIVETAESRACWERNMVIARAEWSAFNNNSYKHYKNIERPEENCSPIKSTPAPADIFAVVLKFELPARAAAVVTAQRVPDKISWSGSGFSDGSSSPGEAVTDALSGISVSSSIVRQDVSAIFTSRIYFAIWDAGGNATRIYARAVPTNNGIEAAPGASIGLSWLNEVYGAREARLVRIYLEWLENIGDIPPQGP